ncbi:MAG: fold metallo-hydrolase [Rhodospirillales bacterium]|nr:fold metallo-hydrolase [Rhodospirillales bacterium]
MSKFPFTRGVHALGNGCWAFLLPSGSWGWSNAGLITDGDATLLVDTLFDLKLTAEMLGAFRDAVPAARRIETLVNTHANGDHVFGNELVKGARIVSTNAVVTEMHHMTPDNIADMIDGSSGWGEGGRLMREVFSPFEFRGITLTDPTDTFDGTLDLKVGDKDVHLVDVGPAHTTSDILVYVPKDKIVFTGDILFAGAHPAIWAGPTRNWIKACDQILAWDVDLVVPGHGPISDKNGVREFKAYLEYLLVETRLRYEAGMSFEEAAFDIPLGAFDHWGDSERMVPNVIGIYGELSGTRPAVTRQELWGLMARYHARRKADLAARAARCGCGNSNHAH